MRARLVFLILLATVAAAADQRHPMTAVELLSVPIQSDVRLAPGGAFALFVRTQADWDQDRLVSHIWKVGADGSEAAKMTNGKTGERSPRWSPDGKQFCFVATREGEMAQLFVQSFAGGEAIQVSRHETSASDPEWSPDGKGIMFLADDADSEKRKEAKKLSGDVVSYDRDYRQKHLWLLDLASETETRGTEGSFSVLEYLLSTDGSTLVYVAAPTPLVDDGDKAEIYVRPLAGGEARRLTNNDVGERGARLSPDGRSVLFVAGTNERFEPYYQDHLFLVPAIGGTPRMLLKETTDEIEAVSLIEVDGEGKAVSGPGKRIACDTVVLAVGMVPSVELLGLLGCEMHFNKALGGYVPLLDAWMRTSVATVRFWSVRYLATT